jgi:hypothetical protein
MPVFRCVRGLGARRTRPAAVLLPTSRAPGTITVMQPPERRTRRTHLISQALHYQLVACCQDGAIEAMVVADEDGLALARSGDPDQCDEVAAKMAQVVARTPQFSGTLIGAGQRWDVDMTKVVVDGSPLLVCAVGGSAEQRQRQITRGAQGALRILRAA